MRKANVVGLAALAVVVLSLFGTRATSADHMIGHEVVGMAAHAGTNNSGSTVYIVWNDGLVQKNRTSVTGCGIEQWCGWLDLPHMGE